jgi:hypothetical protein
MNLKHDLETPISTLKTIFALLKEDGALPERLEKNAEASFDRIKDILQKWKEQQSKIEVKNGN